MVFSDINLSPPTILRSQLFIRRTTSEACAQQGTQLPEARLNNRASLKIIYLRFTFYSALLLFNCQSHRIFAVVYCRSKKKALTRSELGKELILNNRKIEHETILKLFELCCFLRSVSSVFMASGGGESSSMRNDNYAGCRLFFTKLIAQVRGSLTIISCSFSQNW